MSQRICEACGAAAVEPRTLTTNDVRDLMRGAAVELRSPPVLLERSAFAGFTVLWLDDDGHPECWDDRVMPERMVEDFTERWSGKKDFRLIPFRVILPEITTQTPLTRIEAQADLTFKQVMFSIVGEETTHVA